MYRQPEREGLHPEFFESDHGSFVQEQRGVLHLAPGCIRKDLLCQTPCLLLHDTHSPGQRPSCNLLEMGHHSLLFLIVSMAKFLLQDFPFDSQKPSMEIKMITEHNFLFLFAFLIQPPFSPSKLWEGECLRPKRERLGRVRKKKHLQD